MNGRRTTDSHRRPSTAALRKRLRGVVTVAVPFLGTITAVATDEPVIALTFDDGPDPISTPTVLDLLDKHGAHGTFFVLGQQAARHPGLINRATDTGHAVGTHGWEHRSLLLEAPPGARAAARWRRELIRRGGAALGYANTHLYRPAYGHQNPAALLAAHSAGYDLVGWSISAEDWAGDDATVVAERVLDRLAPGAIVLFHDALADAYDDRFFDRSATMAALEQILHVCRDHYRFVTVPELLQYGPALRRFVYPRPAPDTMPAVASRV